ncbi:MAG: hypothetical protein WCR72_15225 [Bacteroidota bacterium]
MSEFEMWLYRGLIAVLGVIVAWGVKLFASKVFTKFDELIEAVNALSGKYLTHEGQIKQVVDQQFDHAKRLNDHGARIRQVELKQAEIRRS